VGAVRANPSAGCEDYARLRSSAGGMGDLHSRAWKTGIWRAALRIVARFPVRRTLILWMVCGLGSGTPELNVEGREQSGATIE